MPVHDEFDDELIEASPTADPGSDSETASDSSSDSSVKRKEETAEDTQTLEKEQKTGKHLKASIVAQRATNEKRVKELFKMSINYPSDLEVLVNVLFFDIVRTCIEIFLL